MINTDGYLYFVTAKVFSEQGLVAATQLFTWPFYPVLMSTLNKYLSIPIEYAPMIITGLFYLLLIYSFISLIKQLGGGKQEQFLGGLLLVTLPLLNNYLESVIRDHGYIAFLFFGMTQLVKFAHKPSFIQSLLWSMSVILASLFRVEALVIMLVTSLVLILLPSNSLHQRVSRFIKINTPLFIICAAIGLFYFFVPKISVYVTATRFHTLSDWFLMLINQSYYLYIEKSEWVAASLSKAMKPERMWMIFIGGFGFYILFKLATGLTLLNCIGCYWHAKKNKFYWEDKRWWIIYALVAVLTIMVIFYIALHYFLSQQYLLPLILTLLLLGTFGLSSLINYLRDNPPSHSRLMILLIVCFSYNIADILFTFGTSKTYIKEAANWSEINLPAESQIFTNHIPTAFYSNRLTQERYAQIDKHYSKLPNASLIKELQDNPFDYAVVYISRENKQLSNLIKAVPDMQPLNSFTNNKGDSIVVYQKRMDNF